jgi:retinol dehydrogenase-12
MNKDDSMTGKTCMVTGATSGIGEVTARALAEMGARVVLVGRDKDRSERTTNSIRERTGNAEVAYLLADLSVQQEIHNLVDVFHSRFDRLHVLVNNAGAYYMSRQTSRDGHEMTFALNHMSYFILTHLLLDTLIVSAPSRIVNVSSSGHRTVSIDFDDLQAQRRYGGWQRYRESKLANLLFTYELARRLEGTGVTVNALHPGLVATNLAANNGWFVRAVKHLVNLFSLPVEKGAETSIYLASSPEVEGVTGKYFVEKVPTPSSAASYVEADARRLWEVSAALTNMDPNVLPPTFP